MLEALKELISINSFENGDKIIDYLSKQFSQFSEEILAIKNKENDNKSIIIGLNTKLKNIEPIVLSGHIDTVAPDYEKYNTDPLALTIVDDKAYGLGSIDMKSFTACILDNVQSLKKLDCPIVVALTTDEETDLICIQNVIETFKKLNIKPKFTIVGEPTESNICNRANGCYEYLIEVFGKSCHSSIIEDGINAINIMAKMITEIEEKQKDFDILTSNCGVINGGDIVNRVPDYCSLRFDIRSSSTKQVEEFLDIINRKIIQLTIEYGARISIKKLLEIPPLEAKNENIILDIADSFNLKINKFMGGCEAGYYQALSGDAIIFGVGDMALAHKPNEYVNIDEYKIYGEELLKLISKIEQIYYA